jgi:protein-disulfide isomerase
LDAAFDEKIKRVVLDIIKQNPQLLMDAMGEGIAKKREDAVKQLGNSVIAQQDTLFKQGLQFGNKDAKKRIICFFDPLCKHCIEFQGAMIKLVRSGMDVAFSILPVGVLGEDSVLVGKVYLAVYDKSPGKALEFIEAIISNGEAVDKDAIKKALKKVNLTYEEIEAQLAEADKKLAINGVSAEKLGIPVVPAIFYIFESTVKMLQTTNAEQIANELNDSPGSIGSDKGSENAKSDNLSSDPDVSGLEKEKKN